MERTFTYPRGARLLLNRDILFSQTEENEDQAQQADGTHLHVPQWGQAAPEHRHFVHSQTEENEDQAQQADGTHLHVPQGGQAAPEHRCFVHSQKNKQGAA
jgi:hypothetical protein